MMAPREPPAPGMVDRNVAANLRKHREELGLSQADLAARMAAAGWPFHPQTVSRIEAGTRKVNIGEGEALARFLGTTLGELTWPDPVSSTVAWFDKFIASADDAYAQVAMGTRDLLFARAQLERGIEAAGAHETDDQDDVRQVVDAARDRLGRATPQDAVERGTLDYGQWFPGGAAYIEFDVAGEFVRPRAPWDEEAAGGTST
jgi:transcriptional regulator with XRE-family HTH domain